MDYKYGKYFVKVEHLNNISQKEREDCIPIIALNAICYLLCILPIYMIDNNHH